MPAPNPSALNQPEPNSQLVAEQEPFLIIDDISKVYATPKGSFTVVENINLTVKEGEFVCIIGHSGCGKSTLLNMVAGFSKPTQGEVRLRGVQIAKPGPDRMMVFQNYALLPWKTAFENVYLAVKSAYPKKSKAEKVAIAQEHLAMVGLTEAAHKRPNQLSGGMKQRVAIARALAIRPEVLILDEPFGALDAITKEELQEELLQIWRDHKVTVLMITHDIDEALFLADRVVMMTNGPAANIGEVLEIPFPRPRVRSQIVEDPQYYELRNYALDFLFHRFAHSEDPINTEEEKPVSAQPNTVTDAVIFTAATASIFVIGGLLAVLSNATGANQVEPAPVAVETTPTVIEPVIETTVPVITPSPLATVPSATTTPPVLVSPSPLVTPTNAPIDSVAPPVTPVPGAIATTTPAPTPTVSLSPTPDVTATTPPLTAETPALSPTPAATTPPLTPETAPASPAPTAATTPPLSATTSPVSPSPTADTVEQISDPAEIETLQQGLYQRLDSSWQTFPTFQENLVYRVSVTPDGAIAKYEPTNEAAEQYVQEIPLSTLVPSGASAGTTTEGPVADYKVTFTPAGELQVTPW